MWEVHVCFLARCSCCQRRRRQVFCLYLVLSRLFLFGVTFHSGDCPPCGLQLSVLLLCMYRLSLEALCMCAATVVLPKSICGDASGSFPPTVRPAVSAGSCAGGGCPVPACAVCWMRRRLHSQAGFLTTHGCPLGVSRQYDRSLHQSICVICERCVCACLVMRGSLVETTDMDCSSECCSH
jgi:hypothetical protein